MLQPVLDRSGLGGPTAALADRVTVSAGRLRALELGDDVAGGRVCVVVGDLRRPVLAERLGLVPTVG